MSSNHLNQIERIPFIATFKLKQIGHLVRILFKQNDTIGRKLKEVIGAIDNTHSRFQTKLKKKKKLAA